MSSFIVKICKWRSCSERHADYIEKRVLADIDFYNYGDLVTIESCMCQGRCKEGPTVGFWNDIQVGQNPIKTSEILKKKVAEIRKRLQSKD